MLYYLSLGVAVFLEADKRGLDKEDASALPKVKKVLKEGWYHAIPILVLIVALLGFGYSANYAAIFAIVALLAVGITKTLITQKRFPFEGNCGSADYRRKNDRSRRDCLRVRPEL